MNKRTEDREIEILIFGKKLIGMQIFKALVVGAVILCVIFPIVIMLLISDWSERGQFGDMFGALNALFSALALVGVIYAILLQRKELELQREEMKLSREELAQQNKIISEQLKTMSESYKLQQEKELWESEPVIKCEGGQSDAEKTSLTLTNYGARITQVEAKIVSPNNNYQIGVRSGEVLDYHGHSTLIIIGDCRLTDLVIEISYVTRMNTSGMKRFIKPKGALDLIQLNTMGSDESARE